MTEWQQIETAPRDGRELRIKDETGKTYRMFFSAPHWWVIAKPRGAMRMPDASLYRDDGTLIRATHWQEVA